MRGGFASGWRAVHSLRIVHVVLNLISDIAKVEHRGHGRTMIDPNAPVDTSSASIDLASRGSYNRSFLHASICQLSSTRDLTYKKQKGDALCTPKFHRGTRINLLRLEAPVLFHLCAVEVRDRRSGCLGRRPYVCLGLPGFISRMRWTRRC